MAVLLCGIKHYELFAIFIYYLSIKAKMTIQQHNQVKNKRPGPESNRPTRICSPLHNRSATWPNRDDSLKRNRCPYHESVC